MGLELAGLDYELAFVALQDLGSEDYLKINPNGKVPTLETEDGPIFETHAILRYAARKAGKLYGSSPYEQAQVDQWLDWVNCDLQTLAPQFLFQIFGFEFPGIPYQKDGMFRAKAQFLKKLATLNNALKDKDFIVGNEISIADVAILNATIHFLTFGLADKQRKQYANIFNWLDNVAKTDSFKKWYGRLRLSPKPLNFAKIEAAAAKPKKQEKKKNKGGQQQQKPKQEKKKGIQFPPSKNYRKKKYFC